MPITICPPIAVRNRHNRLLHECPKPKITNFQFTSTDGKRSSAAPSRPRRLCNVMPLATAVWRKRGDTCLHGLRQTICTICLSTPAQRNAKPPRLPGERATRRLAQRRMDGPRMRPDQGEDEWNIRNYRLKPAYAHQGGLGARGDAACIALHHQGARRPADQDRHGRSADRQPVGPGADRGRGRQIRGRRTQQEEWHPGAPGRAAGGGLRQRRRHRRAEDPAS